MGGNVNILLTEPSYNFLSKAENVIPNHVLTQEHIKDLLERCLKVIALGPRGKYFVFGYSLADDIKLFWVNLKECRARSQ